MRRARRLALAASSLAVLSGAARAQHALSVPELEEDLLRDVPGAAPCVRLASASGAVGCGGTGRGPLQRVTDGALGAIADGCVALVPPGEAPALLKRLAAGGDADVAGAAGVLVEAAGAAPVADSPAPKTPLGALAPTPEERSYAWNPAGSGLVAHKLGVPVWLLDAEGTAEAVARADENAQDGFAYPLHSAELKAEMYSEDDDAAACLRKSTCQPLGGWSVLASLPAGGSVPASEAADGGAVLVVAHLDSNALFHDAIAGTGAQVAGLVALLAAADAIATRSDAALTRRVAFAAVAAEPWGYAGSRRLAREWAAGHRIAGLAREDVGLVVELGALGNAGRLVAHRAGGDPVKEAALADALTAAGARAGVPVKPAASASVPGLPPSSLLGMRARLKGLAGVVVAEYDEAFSSPYYWSRFDDALNATRLAAAADAIADAVHRLAGAGAPLPVPAAANTTLELVSELAECLLSARPGLTCPLVYDSLMRPTAYKASHYVGVLQSVAEHPHDQNGKGNVARLVWNFLANRTGVLDNSAAPASCRKSSDCGATNATVCVGYGSRAGGHCTNATVAFAPAFSHRLHVNRKKGRWEVKPPEDEFDEDDALWTESNWPNKIGVTLYQADSSRREMFVLVSGLCLTVVGAVVAVAARSVIDHKLKHS